MTSSKSLAIVLPAYNEEAGIIAAVEAAIATSKWLPDGVELVRVIVVNDGSIDATGVILDQLAQVNPALHVITHQRCEGLGSALRSGFAEAEEDVILYTDADQPIVLEDLRPAIADVAADVTDLVAAFRLNPGDTGLRRRTYTKAYAVIVRLTLNLKVRDVNFAAKVVSRAVLDAITLTSEGSLIDAELLARAERAGFSMSQYGVSYQPRLTGTSTLSAPRVIGCLLTELWRLRRELSRVPMGTS